MAFTAVVLITLTLLFLAYQHPSRVMDYVPRWLHRTFNRHDEATEKISEIPTLSVSSMADEDLSEDEDTTPKASPRIATARVPAFTISEENRARQPSVPTINGTSARTNPRIPSLTPPRSNPVSTLMPPPPSRTPLGVGRSGANPATSLRVPTVAALPNPCISATSQQRVSDGKEDNKSHNGRGQVLLAPGHSPMDWAALTRRENLSGVSRLERVPPSKLKTMTGRKGKPAWTSWQGKVYNITPYLPFHPGGKPELMRAAGRDGTQLFMDVHPWVNFENMLSTCLVGIMVSEEQSPLEEMD